MTNDLQDKRGRCKAAPARFPYREHRNMREVMMSEFLKSSNKVKGVNFDQWCNRG